MKSIIQYLIETECKNLLGKTRNEVRQIINSKVIEFKKTPDSKNTTDAFDDKGIHVYYDDQGNCKEIENFNVGLKSPKETLKHLRKSDKKTKIDQNVATSHKTGVAVFSDRGFKSSDGTVDSVLIFKRGVTNL